MGLLLCRVLCGIPATVSAMGGVRIALWLRGVTLSQIHIHCWMPPREALCNVDVTYIHVQPYANVDCPVTAIE